MLADALIPSFPQQLIYVKVDKQSSLILRWKLISRVHLQDGLDLANVCHLCKYRSVQIKFVHHFHGPCYDPQNLVVLVRILECWQIHWVMDKTKNSIFNVFYRWIAQNED